MRSSRADKIVALSAISGRATMPINRREFLSSGAAATALTITVLDPALAQQFPARAVTIIVPYGPGGGSDISARLLAKDLEVAMKQPVTVENRAGGGGWVGWGSLAASKPDGYTIGYVNAPSIFAGYLDRSIAGGARKENLESFTPLVNHVVDYNTWAVRKESKYTSIKDIIEDGKKRPGAVTMNGGGYGSDDHIAMLAVEAATGAKFTMPHFRSTAEGKTQVLGGHIDVLAANISEVAEDVKQGQVRMLGVMAPTRSRFMPNAPTFREQGYDQVWAVSRGIAGPAGLPPDVEKALISFLEKTISSAGHKAKAEALSLEPRVIAGAAYRKFLKDNEQATKKLMKW
jgi:tripartite-type tricarboxylate transporter receptor subunit TctC